MCTDRCYLCFRNCLMANDPSNKAEAEKLYTNALKIDPANETVLTMFAIFKCNGFVCFIDHSLRTYLFIL